MIRKFEKLKYSDPEKVLPQLIEVQRTIRNSNLTEKEKNLRTPKLKKHREGWEAAIFTYGLSKILGTKVYFTPHEDSDYDIVTMWKKEDEVAFTPVQIKEIVPEKLNPYTNINKEIAKLTKYNDVCVAIHINRSGKLELEKIEIPNLKISQLWLFGASSEDQSKWFIAGDILNNPGISEFKYPL